MARLFRRFLQRNLPWIVLAHVGLLLAFWLTNKLFYASTNNYLAKMLDKQYDYITIVLVISGLIGAWCVGRLILTKTERTSKLRWLASWLFGLAALLYIVFFYGSFGLLLHESPAQLSRLEQLVSYYRLILDPLALLAVALVLGFILRRTLARQKEAGRKRNFLPLGAALALFLALWLVPVLLPPSSVYRGTLPPKPLIVAHRGASMLAPENTLASAQLAADMGIYALETDVHISQDGVPYLMHDDTLLRTTDVRSVFPGRAKDRAESFTLADVHRLNAGKWFVEQDPFKVIAGRMVSPDQVTEYQGQMVPTLAEELAIVRDRNLRFIFDLKQPPGDHPFTNSFFDVVLQQIQQVGIDEQIWFLVDRDQLAVIQKSAPDMQPTAGIDYQKPPEATELRMAGYQIVNAEYGLPSQWIRAYQAAGLWVNLYTIDEPWQFSHMWLLRVDSITSSNAKAMVSLTQPIMSLPYEKYRLLWSVIGILGLGFIVVLSEMHLNPKNN
jgi:glycerophosphoryl diester phosphodiesterase